MITAVQDKPVYVVVHDGQRGNYVRFRWVEGAAECSAHCSMSPLSGPARLSADELERLAEDLHALSKLMRDKA